MDNVNVEFGVDVIQVYILCFHSVYLLSMYLDKYLRIIHFSIYFNCANQLQICSLAVGLRFMRLTPKLERAKGRETARDRIVSPA